MTINRIDEFCVFL